MKRLVTFSIFAILCSGAFLILASERRKTDDRPAITVTVAPDPPTTYEQTTITVETAAESGKWTFLDEITGKESMWLLNRPSKGWFTPSRGGRIETYTLPQLFGAEPPPGQEMTVRVITIDPRGKESVVRTRIIFQR